MTEELPAPPKRRRVRRFLLAGVATLLPTVLTAYIAYACYRFVHTNLGAWIAKLLATALDQWDPVRERITNPYTLIAGDVLAVVIVLGAALTVGALAASFVGRRIIRAGERLLLKVPFVRVIYPYVKQITDFILTEKKLRFHRVVVVPYPRQGMYSLGFVTGESLRAVNERTGEDMVHVFIPSSPTPFTGYVVFLPRREVIELPISVDEALRFSISAGVLVPPRQVVEAALEAREHQELPASASPTWATDD